MKIPCREKYIDEYIGRWFIFGANKDGTLVDISDGNKDIFEFVPLEQAERICKAQNAFIDYLYKEVGFYENTKAI